MECINFYKPLTQLRDSRGDFTAGPQQYVQRDAEHPNPHVRLSFETQMQPSESQPLESTQHIHGFAGSQVEQTHLMKVNNDI